MACFDLYFCLLISYFLLNSWLIAFAISLEKHLPPARMAENFAMALAELFWRSVRPPRCWSATRAISTLHMSPLFFLYSHSLFYLSMSMGRVEDANNAPPRTNRLYMSTIERSQWRSTQRIKSRMGTLDGFNVLPSSLGASLALIDVARK